MKKWEYKVVEIELEDEPGEMSEERLEGFLNRAGELGWEMVWKENGLCYTFIFKREKVATRGRPKKIKE